jgi:hypothetical protein
LPVPLLFSQTGVFTDEARWFFSEAENKPLQGEVSDVSSPFFPIA